MSAYQNRINAFSGSVAENQGRVDNYLAKKQGVKEANKGLMNSARAQATAHMTGEFIKGAGFEGAIRAGKPMVGKGLSWLDKKTGFSRGVDDAVNKRFGTRLGQKSRVGETSDAPKRSAIEEGDADAPEVRSIDTSPGSGRSRVINDYENPDSVPDAPAESEMGGNNLSRPRISGQRESIRSNQIQPVENEGEASTETNNVKVRSNQVQPTDSTETKESQGETKEGDPMEEEDATTADLGDASTSTIAEGAETAGVEGAEQATAGGLEGAGAVLDATGVGAVIGVPLQIAGAVLEGAGIYEAGKTIVDWFKEDILGDKPKLNPHLLKQPANISTLAGIGAQATPTFDTTMDVPGGAGSW